MSLPAHSNFIASVIRQIKALNDNQENLLPLHAPVFTGNERRYVLDTIESTMVSSIGEYVTHFEQLLSQITGSRFAVACVNGTSALEMALRVASVSPGDLVVTQSISFVATANAIRHCGAEPVFCDISEDCLGLSPQSLGRWLEEKCVLSQGICREKASGRKVSACVPMHTCGLPCHVDDIVKVCSEFNIPVIEDSAEALGSRYMGKSCGTFGLLGIFSFNGNKICTTGGGGAIVTDNEGLAERARHLTTTGKKRHPWKFYHDEVAWNFRMPNLNAALGVAQLERLDVFVEQKRRRMLAYADMFAQTPWTIVSELPKARSNYWLPILLVENVAQRNDFLHACHDAGVQTRPLWEPLHTLPMYENSLHAPLPITMDMAARAVNLPNGYREG